MSIANEKVIRETKASQAVGFISIDNVKQSTKNPKEVIFDNKLPDKENQIPPSTAQEINAKQAVTVTPKKTPLHLSS